MYAYVIWRADSSFCFCSSDDFSLSAYTYHPIGNYAQLDDIETEDKHALHILSWFAALPDGSDAAM